ncbi:chemotaxis protein CheW [Rhizobium beringeri]
MNAIAVSANEQSTGLAEINTAVNSMDQSTQQNAAMVEQSTAAAASLAQEAAKLRDLVAQFKLEGVSSQPRAADRTSRPVVSPARSLSNKLASAFGGEPPPPPRYRSGRIFDHGVRSPSAGWLRQRDFRDHRLSHLDQAFCVRTTTIREIRGWYPSTSVPHSPPDIVGVMNLRGSVIPIIDLAYKLGMRSADATERSAIVVAEVHEMVLGLVVDGVSDILTIRANQVQPVPEITTSFDRSVAGGHHHARQRRMICFLSLSRLFQRSDLETVAA